MSEIVVERHIANPIESAYVWGKLRPLKRDSHRRSFLLMPHLDPFVMAMTYFGFSSRPSAPRSILRAFYADHISPLTDLDTQNGHIRQIHCDVDVRFCHRFSFLNLFPIQSLLYPHPWCFPDSFPMNPIFIPIAVLLH